MEKEMATHSSILTGEILCTEKPAGLYSPWGHKGVRQDETKQQNTIRDIALF